MIEISDGEDDELALIPSSSGSGLPSGTPSPIKASLVLFHFTFIIFYT